jgi:ribosomal protein S18 acetylase RimI-like enzyme
MGLTVQKANPRGMALYQKMGFGVVREQVRPSDGEPEFYMERRFR